MAVRNDRTKDDQLLRFLFEKTTWPFSFFVVMFLDGVVVFGCALFRVFDTVGFAIVLVGVLLFLDVILMVAYSALLVAWHSGTR